MLKHLFAPLTVKNVVIPNRLAVSPMVSNFCNDDGSASERYIAYHEAKARGGFGLIVTEDYAICPEGRAFSNVAGLWNDGQMPGHAELVRRVHRHGAKIFAQIYHAGRQTTSAVIGDAPVAPSPVPDPFSLEVPRELTIPEIETIVGQFGAACLRAKRCGFDGVELHGGHGYLLAQFMSPYANKRTDSYGGCLVNRLRLPLAVVRTVREACGDDFVIDFRISADEHMPGGRTIEDTRAIAPMLADAGVDMLHVSCSVRGNLNRFIPGQATRHAMLADLARAVKEVVDIPVITVGRINDAHVADRIVASGTADMVAMGRQSLADPETPRKARDGRFDEIRHCIACNAGCLKYLNDDQAIRCVLNPTLGREFEAPSAPSAGLKTVAVIGGGPAGMQAAISMAEQGHAVTVYEKSDRLGGQALLAAMPPAKGEIAGFVAWQANRLEKLGVTVRLNTPAGTDTIGRPDVVVLATGAVPVVPRIPGADRPNVMQANDVLAGRVLPGRRVAVIGGGQVGAETADYLGVIDRRVTIIESLPEIVPDEVSAAREYLFESLAKHGATILTGITVEAITENGVVTACGRAIPADSVVLALGSRSDDGLRRTLEAAGHHVVVIGDAKAVRQILEATKEGYDAALALHTEYAG